MFSRLYYYYYFLSIGLRIYSDHELLIIQWNIIGKKIGSDQVFGGWIIISMNREIIDTVQREILIYFQPNKGASDKILLWETFKVFI